MEKEYRPLLSTVPPPDDGIRGWWHQILRENGRYKCYAVFLALPADFETTKYLCNYADEIHAISGDNCLVIIFSNIGFASFGSDRDLCTLSLRRYIERGHSAKLARIFKVNFDEFPCVIVFRDVRKSDYIKISLKELTVDEIAQSMRSVFSVIQNAITSNQDPLIILENHLNSQALVTRGKSFVGKISQFANKTLETVMEAFIEAYVKAAVK